MCKQVKLQSESNASIACLCVIIEDFSNLTNPHAHVYFVQCRYSARLGVNLASCKFYELLKIITWSTSYEARIKGKIPF